MMRLFFAMSLAAAALATGCASPCDQMKTASDHLTKVTCSSGDVTVKPTFDMNSCQKELSKCTSDDDKKISDYADCVNKLGQCTSDNSQAWVNDFLTCAGKVQGISSGCGGGS